MSKTTNKFSPEVRARAVRMVLDPQGEYSSRWAAVSSIARRLKPGGKLVMTVPAHQWMWSAHDVVNHHQRRYSKRDFKTLVNRSPLKLESIGYLNSLLFPVAMAQRLASKLTGKEDANLRNRCRAELREYVTELATSGEQEYFRANFFVNTPDILTEELVEDVVGEHAEQVAHLDERLAPVFELAAERLVPILIHGGRGLPPIAGHLKRLVDTYPEAQLIIAHAGIADLAQRGREQVELLDHRLAAGQVELAVEHPHQRVLGRAVDAEERVVRALVGAHDAAVR